MMQTSNEHRTKDVYDVNPFVFQSLDEVLLTRAAITRSSWLDQILFEMWTNDEEAPFHTNKHGYPALDLCSMSFLETSRGEHYPSPRLTIVFGSSQLAQGTLAS